MNNSRLNLQMSAFPPSLISLQASIVLQLQMDQVQIEVEVFQTFLEEFQH